MVKKSLLARTTATTLGLSALLATGGAAQQAAFSPNNDFGAQPPYQSALNKNILTEYPLNTAIAPSFDVTSVQSRPDGCYIIRQFNVPNGSFVLLANAVNGGADVHLEISTEDSIVANYRVLRPDSTIGTKPIAVEEKVRTNPQEPDSLARYTTRTKRLYARSMPDLIRVIFWRADHTTPGLYNTIGSYNYWIQSNGTVTRDHFTFGQERRTEAEIDESVGACKLETQLSKANNE